MKPIKVDNKISQRFEDAPHLAKAIYKECHLWFYHHKKRNNIKIIKSE